MTAMTRARPKPTAITPAYTPTFEDDYLDIDHWPHRWRIESSDLRVGERILDTFKLFLAHLLDQKLSRKTLLLHREHVDTLGEEVVRRLHQQPQLRRKNMAPVLLVYLDEDGGPILYPPTSSPKQRSFDSTCLKLRRFILGP
jgi:hypothetical protein